VVQREDQLYNIETILKRRVRKGKCEVYVKWSGYPDSFNQWIDADAVEHYD
jgi:hypothetical protein